ncbi:putative DNA modification/repair radical SAM protein [Weeksellaceae bacterium KMM 9713]|uniref:DNA modification/repair radical SAM protein n=1 Tax=Profundicola chukchiensis TaxID=2961959 RepID=A0A9X4MXZ5_9FLAO|nr:putative DNA modification/repair radical SAM protein [Profundicola chukchiensis]MDG4946941.1 putative DNA modification/repair radical SAM protein [Profundicola chukchiensis]
MNWERLQEKLGILADAAKYDVSCSSSGSNRKNTNKGLGDSSGMGICHTYTEDGRCVSLLKILLTNHCIYDCLYCVSRKSNDIKRAAFTVDEVVELTINFYRRNYIEGLFLSSGIFKNSDFTMERLVRVAKKLRTEHKFNGYIHLKTIPGASDELMQEAGLWADRLSVNIELPTKSGLALLAPDKKHEDFIKPMKTISNAIIENKSEKKIIKSTPQFTPAGQSSQMIIGATNETDLDIVKTSTFLYKNFNLKRVYYSGYVPVLKDNKLPDLGTPVPMVRENRLYQTDWLFRFYQFDPSEIVNETYPHLDLEIDPKLSWALRNRHLFPIDVNTADYHMILRIPGIGVKSAKKIVSARRFGKLGQEQLKKLGIAMNRAQYFITSKNYFNANDWDSLTLRNLIIQSGKSKYSNKFSTQLSLF